LAHRYSRYIKPILFLGDIIILNISFITVFALLIDVDFTQRSFYIFLVVINFIWIITGPFIINPYRSDRVFQITIVLRRVTSAVILHLLIVTILLLYFKNTEITRLQYVIFYLSYYMLIVVWRVVFIYFVRSYRKRGFNYRNIIILGYGEISKELEQYFILHPELGYRLLGFFDEKDISDDTLGKLSEVESFCTNIEVDEIYCCLPYVDSLYLKQIIDLGDEHLIKVKLISDFRGFSFNSVDLERYDHIPILNVNSIPLDSRAKRFGKRAFDIIFSGLIILFLLSWLFPIVAFFIRIDSRGSILFRQKRTGKNNNTFWCLKFRTMQINQDADKIQAVKGDIRITRIGAFLRKYSIDELPQFLNVFIGTMSVVGPRPHMLKHTQEYSKLVDKFMARHFVKPGITGLAQAKGYRGETETVLSMKNRVTLDRFYIANWSLILDIKIILLTITSILKDNKNAN